MALALVPGAGCGGPLQACTEIAVFSVNVTVVDGASAPVSDATLKYTVDGGPEKSCEQEDPTKNAYICGVEEAGHFVITATRGTATKTVEVDVSKDECHVVPEKTTITLSSS